jgi:hypothetical protein
LQTPLTGSVYGRTYTWFNDDLLIAGGGGGISAYDINDPNGPRVWQLRTTQNEQQDQECAQPSAYGDVQVSGTRLFYTCMTLGGLGNAGSIGSAYLNYLNLQPFVYAFSLQDNVARDQYIGQVQNNDHFYGVQFASLGQVYADPQGASVAGAWSIGGSTLAYERIGSVDTKANTADRAICVASVYDGYCGNQALSAVGAQPLAVHAQISVDGGGAVAYQGAQLFATSLSKSLAATSTYAPQWVSGDTLLVTNVLSTATDASGVTRQVTSVQMANGAALTALIAGARDIALR